MKLSIKDVEERKLLLYKYVRGSTAYGLTTPTSDVDLGGVYIEPIEMLLGLGCGYPDGVVSDEKNDVTYYSLKKYLTLLSNGNPNMLESLFVDEKHMVVKPHESIRTIFDDKDKFLTKNCIRSMSGYAKSQLIKAKGLKKKVFNPLIERKELLDYIFTFNDNGSIPIKDYLSTSGFLKQEFCGLSAIPNMHQMYALYYDFGAHYGETPIGYRGIVTTKDGEESNEIRLSSIPKGLVPLCYVSVNLSGYSLHCKEYREYKEWELKRNVDRFQSTIDAGKQYDLKNAMHMVRLLIMALEIVEGKGFNVERTHDREMLMDIRFGKWDYSQLIEYSETLKNQIDTSIKTCDLPDSVDPEFVNELLINIRKNIYGI